LAQIFDAILRGELRKGDLLPSERQIAMQTGISRSSVREAMRILSEAGMLQATSGWGGGTRLVTLSMPAKLLGLSLEEEISKLLDFYEARNIIETSAAQLTALRATPAQILEMEQVVIDMQKLVMETPNDFETYFAIDSHFHRLVVRSSGNSTLYDLYIPILRKLWLVNDVIEVSELHHYGLPSMIDFVQAVKARNPKAAKEAIETHVQPLMDMIQQGFHKQYSQKEETIS
jgi:GntR family transcriptional repressor for pyruvate dehydrogenase complex